MIKRNNVVKYTTAALIAGVLCACVLTGCGSKKIAAVQETQATETSTVNTVYDESKPMRTVKGEEIQPGNDRFAVIPDLGFGMLVPESWDNMINLNFVAVEQAYCVMYIPPSVMPDLENMTEEEINAVDFEAVYAKQINALKILYVAEGTSEDKVKSQTGEYDKLEKLGTLNGNTYYIAYKSGIKEGDLPDLKKEDIEAYAAFAASFEELKGNIAIFPIDEYEEGKISNEGLQNLQATDMNGNPVDGSIFSNYDLTAVNVWATWCGPCVEEMPDLAKVYKDLPENANLITICMDGDESKEAAEAVLKESSAEFVTLCGDENLRTGLLKDIYAYPTTFFVNRNGETVGDSFVGGGKYDDYMKEINNRLGK